MCAKRNGHREYGARAGIRGIKIAHRKRPLPVVLLNGAEQLHVGYAPRLHQLQRQVIACRRVVAFAGFEIGDDPDNQLTGANRECDIRIDRDGLLHAVQRRPRSGLRIGQHFDLHPEILNGHDVAYDARVFHR